MNGTPEIDVHEAMKLLQRDRQDGRQANGTSAETSIVDQDIDALTPLQRIGLDYQSVEQLSQVGLILERPQQAQSPVILPGGE